LLPVLWIVSGLSIGVELEILNAALPGKARSGVPAASPRFGSAEFVHGDAGPDPMDSSGSRRSLRSVPPKTEITKWRAIGRSRQPAAGCVALDRKMPLIKPYQEAAYVRNFMTQ
jgi:hypothetical protein